MKKIFLLLTTLLIVSATFQSCKKDKDDELTTAEAKALIATANQDLSALVTSVKEGEAVELIEKFMDFSKKKITGNKGTEGWMDDMFDQLDQVIDFEQLEDELENEGRFYFSHYLGKYTWDYASNSWTKTSLDHIEFAFPSEENFTTNDVLFSLDSYTDAQATLEGDVVWIPTSLHASVKQNGVKLIGFDVNEIDFDSNLFYFYKKVDVSLFLSPVTVNTLYDNRTATNFYAAYDISNGTQSFGMSADLNTLVVLTENFDEQDFKDVSGEININNLDFVYDVNLEHIADYNDEPTDAQINADINVNVLVDNTQIGSLLFENDEVYIVYNDGSRELFQEAFSDVINDINDAMEGYEAKNNKAVSKQKRKLIKFILFKTKGFKNSKGFVKHQYSVLSK